METEGMEQYLDTFKYGMPPHGGSIGLGASYLAAARGGKCPEACLFL